MRRAKSPISWVVAGITLMAAILFIGLNLLSRPATLQTFAPGKSSPEVPPPDWRKTTTIYLGQNQFYLLDRLSPRSDGAPKALWAFPNDSLTGTLRRVKQRTDTTLGPGMLLFIFKPLQSASVNVIADALDCSAEAKVTGFQLSELTEADRTLLQTVQAR